MSRGHPEPPRGGSKEKFLGHPTHGPVDARILNTFEGAAEIQAQVIARRILEGGVN